MRLFQLNTICGSNDIDCSHHFHMANLLNLIEIILGTWESQNSRLHDGKNVDPSLLIQWQQKVCPKRLLSSIPKLSHVIN